MNGPSRHFSKNLASLLRSFLPSRSPEPLHALLLTSGHLSAAGHHLLPELTSLYSLSGHVTYARILFDKMPRRTTFLYNTLIRGHVRSHEHIAALRLYVQMLSSCHRPDNFTYPFALKACGDILLVQTGVQVHCNAFVSGFCSNAYVQNSLMAMYMNCGREMEAEMVFDGMIERNIVSWNTMIAGWVGNGQAKEALLVFDRMVGGGVMIDEATVVSALPACAHLKDLERGRWLHELAKANNFVDYVPIRNSLIDMYAKCGCLEEAKRLFDEGDWRRDVVSWTAIIGGYASNGCALEAIELAYMMQLSGIKSCSVTMVSLLSACSSKKFRNHGRCIHGSSVRLNLNTDIVVETALIDMYANCCDMDLSLKVFYASSRRTATWNATISGYTRNSFPHAAIGHFKLMLAGNILPDHATITSVLPAYSNSADLKQAMNMHCFLIKTGFLRKTEAATGLVDIYAKTGCLDAARELFEGMRQKDFIAWSAIISSYGKHGHAGEAIQLLNQMLEAGEEPNEVTFTSVLYSCSHSGLVDEGVQIFNRMLQAHQVRPSVDHFACVVDLLGRAGRLKEAYDMIKTMPFEANNATWGALLGACVIHEDVELGEIAANRLFEMEPENTGHYVLLRNIYAAVGRWEDVEAVRRLVKERGLTKAPGCSSL